MGKEGDLWDDSALINAFDHAISTYKKMGGYKKKDSSAERERVMDSGTGLIDSNVEFPNYHTTRDVDKKRNIPAIDAPNSGENPYVPKLEENHVAQSQVDQPHLDSTSSQDIQNVHNSYAYAQVADDYNQLVTKYYDLEEKRLKVLEQLNQYGGLNYQYVTTASGAGVPYSNSQDYSKSAYQFSDPNVGCTCCSCYSECLTAPCTSVPGCFLGGSRAGKLRDSHSVEMDHKMLSPCEDDEIHKLAMGAVEKALSSIRTVSGDSSANEEKENSSFEPEQINGSETDLTAVLNAWYSAGLYTGKYLVEQSIANKRHT
ncbi:hypothetical protein Lal_00007573 [Lupinus albus]|uniref:Survival Motor Neuron Gemin2-binding domain-containing protein n=1 Tax=Lupinus albus TaxID=3870 RepID=A0A6A4PCI1_LUPAL|nr:hypothetical protein Lalb_Chr16g0381091 [Lupinus albus]KAF1874957.1 hypothetical protein Lal_00007573 [Lupinus albus]